jgi:tRNA(fMet)-specific endonuclease VapC
VVKSRTRSLPQADNSRGKADNSRGKGDSRGKADSRHKADSRATCRPLTVAFLLDTNVAIHLRDGDPMVAQKVAALEGAVLISIVTRVELEEGVYREPAQPPIRRARLDAMLSAIPALAFDDLAAKTYAAIVASAGYSRRKLLDRMIAAQALVPPGNLGHLQPGSLLRCPWSLVAGVAIEVAEEGLGTPSVWRSRSRDEAGTGRATGLSRQEIATCSGGICEAETNSVQKSGPGLLRWLTSTGCSSTGHQTEPFSPLFGYHAHRRRAGHRAWNWNRGWCRCLSRSRLERRVCLRGLRNWCRLSHHVLSWRRRWCWRRGLNWWRFPARTCPSRGRSCCRRRRHTSRRDLGRRFGFFDRCRFLR